VDWAAPPRAEVVSVVTAKDGIGEMVVNSVSVAALAAEFVHVESMERRETTVVSSVVRTIKSSSLLISCCCSS